MTINFFICNASLELFFGKKNHRSTKLTLLQEHIHNPRTFNEQDLYNDLDNKDSSPLNHQPSRLSKRDWSEVRPDLLHFCLLSLHDSILNKEGKIQVYVHTLDGRLYKISKDFRVPRTFKVFNKVFANFLHSNSRTLTTESGEVLVERLEGTLESYVPDDSVKIAVDNRSPFMNLRTLLSDLSSQLENTSFFISLSPVRSLDSILYSDVVDVSSLHKAVLSRDFHKSTRDPDHLQSLEDSYSNYTHTTQKISKYDYCLSLREYDLSSLANCYTLVCTLESLLGF